MIASAFRSSRRSALLAALAIWLAAAGATVAHAGGPDVNVDADGIALRGYDPVAYFADGRPVAGDPALSAVHDGTTYRFASAANRDAFLAEPAKYLPQYGGFCAYGASLGAKINADPAVWKVVDGKLYLNVNAQAQSLWKQDIPGNVAKADANWPAIKDGPASE